MTPVMNQAMRDKKAYWIGGTAAGAVGVALVRLLAPALDGLAGLAIAAAGYALVVAGITIIALATRRGTSEAFITVDKDAAD